jgi:DNA repair ATPase RecN
MGVNILTNPSEQRNPQLGTDYIISTNHDNLSDSVKMKKTIYNLTTTMHKNPPDKVTVEKVNNLTIYHQNIQGLKNKINELILFVSEVKPHLTKLLA